MPSVPLPHGTILLVDDEAKIRELLAGALTEEGHDVIATGSPREARRARGERPFDLLIVDNLMPELSGPRADPRGTSARSPRASGRRF